MTVRGIGSFMMLLIGVAFLIAGSVLTFWFGLPMRRQALASVSWPTTEGRITRSQLQETFGKGGTSRTADVEYDYALDGREFVGSRVWIGDGYSSSPGTEHRAAVKRYPAGRQVQVYYDPEDPAESVLEPGSTWSGSMLLLMGMVFLSLGCLLVMAVLLPLLFVIVMAASASSGSGGDMRDFDRPPLPSSRSPAGPAGGDRAALRPRPDDGDDGITIG